MTEVTIEKKKYIILPLEEYNCLKIKASSQPVNLSLMTIDEAEAHSIQLINGQKKNHNLKC